MAPLFLFEESTVEKLKHFLPITPASVELLLSYFYGFQRRRQYPRFYMAPLLLGSKSEFRYGVVNGCLCILKTKVLYGHVVMYLILPPIHILGDDVTEREVLKTFYRMGIGAKLSDTDVALYRLSKRVTVDPNNAEFIYRAGDYTELAGAEYKKWRYQVNELEKKCILLHHYTSMVNVRKECSAVDFAWGRVRGASTLGSKKITELFDEYTPVSHCFGYTLSRDNVPCAYGISQLVTPTWGCLLVGHHTFSKAIGDAGLAAHLIDMRHWAHKTGPDGLFNMGAAIRGAGLKFAKEKLRPVYVQQIYTLKPKVTMTLEDYNNITQQWRKPPVSEGFDLLDRKA